MARGIPKTNNVYGQIVAPDGLRPVHAAIEKVLGPGCASIFRARTLNPDEMLRVLTDVADIQSLPLPGGMEHLFNGAVGGSAEEVVAFVQRLSDALADAKVEHSFEIHDGRQVVRSLP